MTTWKWLAGGIVCASTALAQEGPNPSSPFGPEAPPAENVPAPEPASSTIDAVTVYQGNALVSRLVDVPEGRGLVEVIVTPLPSTVLPDSLYTESSDDLRVLSTRFRARAVQEDTRAEVRAREDTIRKLEAEGRRLQAQIQVARQNQQFFDKLEGFTAATAQNLVDRGRFDGEGVIAFAKFLLQSRMEKSASLVALEQQAMENTEAVAFAKRQLAEIASGSSRTANDAVILIDKTVADAGPVRLNYLVSSANWDPQYRLRAGGMADPVRLEYLAAINQQTGEEWTNADVTLSTAQPSLNAMPPSLSPLTVSVNPLQEGQTDDSLPNDYRAVIGAVGGMGGQMGGFGGMGGSMGAMGGGMGLSMEQLQAQVAMSPSAAASLNQAAAAEQARELLARDEGSGPGQGGEEDLDQTEGPSVTFHLPTRLTVPSRHDPLLIEVARAEMKPEFFNTAVPVLSPRVYRQAHLTNTGDFVLLPGVATMYVGKDFVGRMTLPLVAAGEQFTVGFGVDPQVQVYRRLVDKSRTTQGGNQVRTYDFRIAVRSFRNQPVAVQIWDRLPRADSETLAVHLVKSTPDLSSDATYQRNVRPDNLLRWDLTVPPTANGEKPTVITYQFELEYARGMGIDQISAGLQESPIGGGADNAGFGGMGGGFRSLPTSQAVDHVLK